MGDDDDNPPCPPTAHRTMACTRESARMAGSFLRRKLPLQQAPICSRRFASTHAQQPKNNNPKDLGELDQASSFSTPPPSGDFAEKFDTQKRTGLEGNLPGNRYQYHPPKFDRGPLHPVQSPPSSDPIARDFVPGPFNHPRMKHSVESSIAQDLLTLTYQHHYPGEERAVSTKGQLRTWDGSSPYHKGRGVRGARGPGSDRFQLVERDITFNNIPTIKAVSVSFHSPEAGKDKEYLNTAKAIMLAITGQYAKLNVIKSNVGNFGIREGQIGGVSTTMTGEKAYEFLDKLVTLVLPRIKEWPGVKGTSGDGNGNINLGLDKDSMAFFPELEYNFSAYPSKLMTGCDISIQTTATSDRHARLLLEAIGIPFYGEVK